jgi:hypothetical protein
MFEYNGLSTVCQQQERVRRFDRAAHQAIVRGQGWKTTFTMPSSFFWKCR